MNITEHREAYARHSAACHRRWSTILWSLFLAGDLPTDSLRYNTFACANHRDLNSQSVFFIASHRTRVIAHRRSHPSHHCLLLCPACHTQHRIPESHSKHRRHLISRPARRFVNTCGKISSPSINSPNYLLGECTTRLQGLTLAYRGHDSRG